MLDENITFSAFLATTVDGYIARSDGSIDFLDAANATMTPRGEDCGISKYLASIDAIVMGRKTYLHVLSMENWMYGDIPLFVMSGEMKDLPVGSPPSYETSSTRKISRVYVDGGQLVRSFINASLLSEITITVVPKLIGEGRSLFSGTQNVDMMLEECRHWEFGFVQSRYRMIYGS
ncbi:uncharacterized protein A1O9_04333 [Exophiala aquamarina CBS 119918]|uniref:2,5-diamino-6-ribosylamino-4(3H)-pyrimidinone 5'-phosphate reductase n=1 Tax=Exophiala aquamarina CBS 119918 TaxID=1182545 RepID=A0A072PH82_9EURO|nr:uncharacterized protein A1O9_04333 [Exophiala aquamarina CBS 119918]KEF59489.1 hypothetical protein A1O9_04333 [Exophiala aquamarina CBS 119918]